MNRSWKNMLSHVRVLLGVRGGYILHDQNIR